MYVKLNKPIHMSIINACVDAFVNKYNNDK